jgi:hypothetical protein
MTASNPFPADALDANRLGELTDKQRQNLGALSSDRRRNTLSIAAFLLAGASIVYFLASPKTPMSTRQLVSGGAVALAAILVLRSVTGSDALTRDLRESRVESVEGAIGKRRISGSRTTSTHYLDVGDRAFMISTSTYAALPDAGWGRAFYLPLSGKVVNFESLPNLSPPTAPTIKDVAQSLGTALFSGNRREANEARAGIAALGEALKAPFDESPQAPLPEARDPRPLADAIVGTWTNAMVRVTFSGSGSLTARMFGTERTGRWSVDAAGRLRADITGRDETAEAWIAGGRLTIVADGRGLTFTREP